MSENQTQPVAAEDEMAKALAEIRAEREAQTNVDPVPVDAATVPEVAAANPEPTEASPQVTEPKATPNELSELQKAQAELQKARSEIGRVNTLNRLYNEARAKAEQLERENAALRKPPEPASAEVQSAAKARLAEVAAKVKDFPELSGIVAAIDETLAELDTKAAHVAKQAAAQVVQPLEGLRAEAEQRRAQEQAAAYQAAMQVFQSTYPTAVETVNSQDFNAWISSAPKHVQMAYRQGSTPDEAMAVLDAYDAHLRRTGKASIAQYQTQQTEAAAAPKPTKDSRLQSAAGISSRPSGARGALPPQDDFDASLAFFRRERERKAANA